MTYITQQTPEELRAHMNKLTATEGWREPFAARLWAEIQVQDSEAIKREQVLEQVKSNLDYALDIVIPSKGATISQQAQELEAKDKRIEWLESNRADSDLWHGKLIGKSNDDDCRIAELERVAQNLINEHCEKGGSEGFHYPAEQQSCFVMRDAMRVLSNTEGKV